MRKPLALAALQVTMLAGIAAKFAWDRATLPRAWVRTAPVDPSTPLRGRYVSLRLQLASFDGSGGQARLEVRPGRQLHAVLNDRCCQPVVRTPFPGPATVIVLAEPVAFFIPEHAPDPSRREPGEELWVEVSVPPQGPPRPIGLAVKRGTDWRPLD